VVGFVMKSIKERLNLIETRNKRVELDKAWETSRTRKIIIAILTYLVIVSFFITAKLPNPFVNSIVPTLGFILSTLSLFYFKKFWIIYLNKNE
jgi:preprotein translocase subunit SecF